MRIALATTWPPTACGIATYSEHLARALVAEEAGPVTVLAEQGGARPHEGVQVVPAFDRREAWAAPLVEAARRAGVDVVHLQHAPDILGMGGELVRALDGLRAHGIRSVVTLHTVYDLVSGLIERKPHAPLLHRMLGARADALIVHQPSMAQTLRAHGVHPARLHEIPHGTDDLRAGDGARIRARHGIPADAPLLLFFGFVHVQKNVHVAIKALPAIRRALPGARLLVAGSVAGGSWYNVAYARHLDRLVRKLHLQDAVTITRAFVDAADVTDTYAAADLVLLPHHQGYGSASGVLHQAIGAGKPLLASRVPKFEELATIGAEDLQVAPDDAGAWARQAIRLLTVPACREPLLDKLRAYADATRWAAVARQHLDVYGNVIANGR